MNGFPVSADAVLSGYRSRLIAVERRAPLTAETYVGEIRFFLEYGRNKAGEFRPEGADWLLRADAPFLAGYIGERRRNIGSRSAAKAISALRSFFRYLASCGIREDNPAAILESPGRSGRLPPVLKKEKVEAMLEAIDISTPLGIRNRALY
jgi:integrase/recombinase XerD